MSVTFKLPPDSFVARARDLSSSHVASVSEIVFETDGRGHLLGVQVTGPLLGEPACAPAIDATDGLDSRPARDLTDRECAKLLGALIGGLCQSASVETVRHAVAWWSRADEAWQLLGEDEIRKAF